MKSLQTIWKTNDNTALLQLEHETHIIAVRAFNLTPDQLPQMILACEDCLKTLKTLPPPVKPSNNTP